MIYPGAEELWLDKHEFQDGLLFSLSGNKSPTRFEREVKGVVNIQEVKDDLAQVYRQTTLF